MVMEIRAGELGASKDLLNRLVMGSQLTEVQKALLADTIDLLSRIQRYHMGYGITIKAK